METSYLKAHLFGNRYPEWMPNLPSDRGQDSNPCARGSQDSRSTSGSIVPRRPQLEMKQVLHHTPAHSYLLLRRVVGAVVGVLH